MNNTQFPTLAANDAVAGYVFQKPESRDCIDIDRKAMEICCVDLISKLESTLSKAMSMPKIDFVDESATITRSMLELLSSFSEGFLSGKPAAQAKEEIDHALTISHNYDEVLSTRSLANTFLRTFWKVEENSEIQRAHAQLGEALIRSCAATLYHAIMKIGFETELGREIDQSTVIFVSELKNSWK